MTALEALLEELKRRKNRDLYFEAARQILDGMIDIFPLHQSIWLQYSDELDALMQLERGYKRVDFVRGEPCDESFGDNEST